MLLLFCFFDIGVLGNNRLPLGRTLYIHETLEWLHRLEDVTSGPLVVDYPFKTDKIYLT